MDAKLEFHLQIILIQEKKWIVAYCPALDLSSCGRNRRDAQKMFREAAGAFFASCVERGTLDKALSELGWEKNPSKRGFASPASRWIPPRILNTSHEIALAV